MTAPLDPLGWLSAPRAGRGIRFLAEGGDWVLWPYERLARSAARVGELLIEAGVRRGDVVLVALGTSPEFVASFFGALAAGATPAPRARPSRFEPHEEHDARTVAILHACRASAVLANATDAPRLRRALRELEHPPTVLVPDEDAPVADPRPTGPIVTRQPAEHMVVQFTSGSTGTPKALRLPRAAVAANLGAIRDLLHMGPDDPTATWLPLHHDMGLVGTFLTPVALGADLWIMSPEQFVRDPARWVALFDRGGARLSAAPAFGLDHAVRRITPQQLDGLDLCDWRALIVGAERIPPATLDAFRSLLEPHGFATRTFLPAYGMAESTLLVTGSDLRSEPRVVRLRRDALYPGSPVVAAEKRDATGIELIACGRPSPGTELKVCAPDGTPLSDGTTGEIAVRSPSLADAYLEADGARSLDDGSGWFPTGDLGVMIGGELVVLGRSGDGLKRRGTVVLAEEIEDRVRAASPELGRGRPTVLLGVWDGVECAVVLARLRPGPWAAKACRVIAMLGTDLPAVVCSDPRGSVLRTTSGKPRRGPTWQALIRGELPVEIVLDDRAGQSASKAATSAT